MRKKLKIVVFISMIIIFGFLFLNIKNNSVKRGIYVIKNNTIPDPGAFSTSGAAAFGKAGGIEGAKLEWYYRETSENEWKRIRESITNENGYDEVRLYKTGEYKVIANYNGKSGEKFWRLTPEFIKTAHASNGIIRIDIAQQTKEIQAFLSLNNEEFSSGDTLIMTVHNNEPKIIGRDIEFGQYYTIEYLQEGEWKEANWLYPWVWLNILYTLKPGESFNQSVELFPVREGTYRVSKEVKGHVSTTLMGTFEVVEGTHEEEIPESELREKF